MGLPRELPTAAVMVGNDFGVSLDADFFREEHEVAGSSGRRRVRLVRLAAGIAAAACVGVGGWCLYDGRLPYFLPGGAGKSAVLAPLQAVMPKVALQPIVRTAGELSAQSAAVTPAVPARSGETQPRPVPSQEPLSRQAQSPAVPAFIAAARCDEAYASTHPGWERYLGQECEFRVFRGGSRIKALQIMVVPGGAISGTFLQRVLSAMLGKSGYTVNSQVRKGKTVIQKGSVGPLADLLIYRALRSGAIRAFVLSIN